jgi:hypothetical protein
MNYLEARQVIENIKKTNQVNSHTFGPVWEFVTQLKYKHSNCAPCLREKVNLVENKINEWFAKQETQTEQNELEEKPTKKKKK